MLHKNILEPNGFRPLGNAELEAVGGGDGDEIVVTGRRDPWVISISGEEFAMMRLMAGTSVSDAIGFGGGGYNPLAAYEQAREDRINDPNREGIDEDGDGIDDYDGSIIVNAPEPLETNWDNLSWHTQGAWLAAFAFAGGGDLGSVFADVSTGTNISGMNPDDPWNSEEDRAEGLTILAEGAFDAWSEGLEHYVEP